MRSAECIQLMGVFKKICKGIWIHPFYVINFIKDLYDDTTNQEGRDLCPSEF